MRNTQLFFKPTKERTFKSVFNDVQKYISSQYAELITGSDKDEKAPIKRYIKKYIGDNKIVVKNMSTDQLVDTLYSELSEFSFLTQYIYADNVEEININSWKDIEVIYSGGRVEKISEQFDNPKHAINIVRRMLHTSGVVMDNASPAVLGHISKNIRIAALKTPIVDEDIGVCASIRIVNPHNLSKEDFIKGGTATSEMLEFLSICLNYGVSICIAGATGSGKTTITGWILSTVPDHKRVFTIESGSRELNLIREKNNRVKNSIIHTKTRHSDNDKHHIDQDMLLDFSLRFHPDIVVVAEMRSAEAYTATEASRTGHAVLTTIHSNSCESTWRRMMSLAKRKHDISDNTLMDLVTEAFPIVVFTKQLENRERKMMEIMECEITQSGERRYNTLYQFEIEENTISENKFIVKGRHKKVSDISQTLKKRLIENGLPKNVLEKQIEEVQH